jgi:hypothetical protein
MTNAIELLHSRIIDIKDSSTIRNIPNLPGDFKRKWKDKYKGRRCVILANGPSLPDTGMLQTIPTDTVIIGVNRSFLRVPSEIHIVVDKVHTLWYGDLLEELTPLAELRMTMYPCKGAYTPKRRTLPATARGNDKKSLLPDLYDYGWIIRGASVGALQVAWWLGFETIVFCGLDLKKAGKHFCEEPEWLRKWLHTTHKEVLEAQVEYFEAVAPLVKAGGRRVINTCLDSGENVFEKVGFEDAIR